MVNLTGEFQQEPGTWSSGLNASAPDHVIILDNSLYEMTNLLTKLLYQWTPHSLTQDDSAFIT